MKVKVVTVPKTWKIMMQELLVEILLTLVLILTPVPLMMKVLGKMETVMLGDEVVVGEKRMVVVC